MQYVWIRLKLSQWFEQFSSVQNFTNKPASVSTTRVMSQELQVSPLTIHHNQHLPQPVIQLEAISFPSCDVEPLTPWLQPQEARRDNDQFLSSIPWDISFWTKNICFLDDRVLQDVLRNHAIICWVWIERTSLGLIQLGFFLPLWQSCDRIKKPSQERLIEWHSLRSILLGISKQSLELFKQTCGWFKQPLKPRTVEPRKSIWGESRPEDGTLGRKCSSPLFRKLGTEIAQFHLQRKVSKDGRFFEGQPCIKSFHSAGAVQLCGRIHGLQSQISRSPKDGISGFEILHFCVGIYHVGNIWTDF